MEMSSKEYACTCMFSYFALTGMLILICPWVQGNHHKLLSLVISWN